MLIKIECDGTLEYDLYHCSLYTGWGEKVGWKEYKLNFFVRELVPSV